MAEWHGGGMRASDTYHLHKLLHLSFHLDQGNIKQPSVEG